MIKDITGNTPAKTALLAAVKGERKGAAFIISGEPGAGKNFAALQFAKALNCDDPRGDGDCCGVCESCLLIKRTLGDLDSEGMQENPHPDAVYINTEKSVLSINLVRDKLTEMNAYRPVKLRKKIAIINSAEKMSREASNSILKELEEPNENVAIILIVNNIESIIPTIISRCRKIDIRRAPLAEVEGKLRELKKGLNENDIEKAVMFSDGKIGEALEYASRRDEIAYVTDVFRALAAKKDSVESIFNALSGIEAKKKERQKNFRIYLSVLLKMLAYIYRDLLLEKQGLKKILENKYGIDPREVKDYNARAIIRIMSLIEASQRDLMANANPNILFNNLFFMIRKEGMKND